jgi:ribosomal protein S18 acetylase RimI-like enzyme
MHIEKVTAVTEELHAAFQRLVPQLSAHKVPPTKEELDELIRSESSILLLARDPDGTGPIAGALCLTVYRVPTGLRSIIEDVIVDETMRQRGIGEAGAEGVSLTSNPQRQAANKLYQSIGFQLRHTNPYYYRLK